MMFAFIILMFSKTNISLQHISFDGTIIELFEENDQKCAKILINTGCIELPIQSSNEYHLGDILKIKAYVNSKDFLHEVSDDK